MRSTSSLRMRDRDRLLVQPEPPPIGSRKSLELVEHEECAGDEAAECGEVVPVQLVTKVEDAEDPEDAERDDFLDNFELVGRKGARADAVRGNLQAIFEERDAPADEDDFPEWDGFEFEMTVPREGHEDVRADEQDDCPHVELDAGR
jgi:hypothetical protein